MNFIARHPDLIGDPIAGENEYLRFLPNRFTVNCEAIDPKGIPTTDLACPKCHLRISDALLELSSVVISITGAPASGKSYFLTTMSWELRKLLPQMGIEFSDADPIANSPLREYEKVLFMNPNPDIPTQIRKTQTDDPKLYRMVNLDGVMIRYPLPFQFLLRVVEDSSIYGGANKKVPGKVIVLYDNAGEDFLPDVEGVDTVAIQHVSKSRIIFMLFDPTQDPRFQRLLQDSNDTFIDKLSFSEVYRQEIILKGLEKHIKRYLNIPYNEKIPKILVIVVPKADIWAKFADIDIEQEPYIRDPSRGNVFNINMVEKISNQTQEFISNISPDFPTVANNFSKHTLWVPVSSTGVPPALVKQGGGEFYGIRPKDISPKWVTVPMVYCLAKFAKGLIPLSKDQKYS